MDAATEAPSIHLNVMYVFNAMHICMTLNSCTKSVIHASTPDRHPVFWAWMTLQLNAALIYKLRRSYVLVLFFDILPLGYNQAVGQTSVRLVQELNVCM